MKPPQNPVHGCTEAAQNGRDIARMKDEINKFHGPEGSCEAVSDMLSRIGDKWTVLIVSYLGNGPMRFNELKRGIGNISQKMLTSTLRNLERDGLISRTVTPTRPPSVEYALTEMGHCLLVPVSNLAAWAVDNRERIAAARASYDARTPE